VKEQGKADFFYWTRYKGYYYEEKNQESKKIKANIYNEDGKKTKKYNVKRQRNTMQKEERKKEEIGYDEKMLNL